MNSHLLTALIVITLIVGSAVSVVKKACKTGYHAWCAPVHAVRQPGKKSAPYLILPETAQTDSG